MGDFSVNISGDALEFGWQKFLGLVGKDAESQQLEAWFKDLHRMAIKQSSSVHCVGMRYPMPFDRIYQPPRIIVGPDKGELESPGPYHWEDKASRSILRGRAFNEKSITADEFLLRDQDALIFGRPGWGKTTLLHHIFRSTMMREDVLPVLIRLRRPGALDDLKQYVSACSRIQKKQHRACTLLLVDGYDEVDTAQRRQVSAQLERFQAQRAGKFYLSCREYYEVCGLNAPEVRLEGFTREDEVRFVSVFLSAFSAVRQDPEAVVSQLEQRGFTEFLSHPLLLTLACIVRAGSTSIQPRSALRLLASSLNVLCFRWDEQKTIDREPITPLDGEDRLRILKNIAYRATSAFVKRERAEQITRRQLTLLAMDKVDPQKVLLEIARFYGILVPAEDGYEFVHRTIHDYLAAKQWVECGEFANQRTYEWNARTGYAACISDDATEVLKKALAAGSDGLPSVTEIIGNDATFDYREITEALLAYFSAKSRVHEHEHVPYLADVAFSKYAPHIRGWLDSDFIRLANSRFLDFIVEYCCGRKSQAADVLVAYAVTELYERMLKLSHQTYEKALAAYKTEKFTFTVPGAKQAQLSFVNPVLQNRLKDYKAGEPGREC